MHTEKVDSQYAKSLYIIFALIVTLGFIVRFWGLGNVGFHGDEETSTMPALEVLNSGLPLLPSGMFYPRAILQSYLIALSIWFFGATEWAVRFPSVLAGTLGIVFTFFLGKRFLPPKWNLFLVLVIALNPWMIEVSQTARMYIFLSTFLILFAVLLFRWEETGRWRDVLAAFIVFLVALQFHQLAILSSFLFFFPFLTRPTLTKLYQGSLFFILSGVVYIIFKKWISSKYFVLGGGITITPQNIGLSPFEILMNNHFLGLGIILLLSLTVIGLIFFKQKDRSATFVVNILFLIGTVFASFFLQYHAALILYICAAILFVRSNGKFNYLLILSLLLLLLFIIQFYFLYYELNIPVIKLIKAFLGSFSIYPFIEFINKFPISFMIFIFPLLYAVRKFCVKSSIPNLFLFLIISVWLPIFCMSFFKWDFPPRYSFHLAPFWLLSCLAGILYFIKFIEEKISFNKTQLTFSLVVVLTVGFIQPFALSNTVYPKCKNFPDHKGAANFMRNITLNSNDLVVAEDVLQQTYYLGKVDYWLRGLNDVKYFVRQKDDVLLDIYTNTPLLGTGKELENVIMDNRRGYLYIIGSEETADFKEYYLSNGILNVLEKYESFAEVLYTGCDNKTLIWRFKSNALKQSNSQ